jgi:chemotaxis protein methyltransferase CheR
MLSDANITTRDFRRFQALVQIEAGIFLSDQKRALLVGRLSPRLRALELASFAAYYERVWSDREELVRMIDALCTNETHFFREPKQFAFLEQQVLPAWRAAAESGTRAKHVRVWSAGCSTGEEPFSIAMSLSWHLPDWSIDVLASDLSTKVLERAAAGIWPLERAEEIPPHYRKTFMLRGRGAQEGKMAARPALASTIRFARINLNDESYPVTGRFDLIFCRNVLIYFDAPSKRRVIDRLLDRLDPAGLFFLGHSESLSHVERVRAAGPTVYALKEQP